MDFTTNYCGPYYSDGKIQSSVAYGSSEPVSKLDAACQRHDHAYAVSQGDYDKAVADTIFLQETKDLGFRGKLYGNLVYYGNKVFRSKKHYMGNALAPVLFPDQFQKGGPTVKRELPKESAPNIRVAQPDNPVIGHDVIPGTVPDGGDYDAPTVYAGNPTTDLNNSAGIYLPPAAAQPRLGGLVETIKGYEPGYFMNPPTRRLYKPLRNRKKRKVYTEVELRELNRLYNKYK